MSNPTTTNETPVAILVRVSTNRRDTERQIHELREVAAANQWTVIQVIEETVSGSSKQRPGLEQALELARSNRIRKLLVHEVTRIARRNEVAHMVLDTLCDHGVSLYWHSQRVETLLPDGRRNPATSLMFALLAEMGRAEKEQLVERTKSGLAEARRRGVRLGRDPGVKDSKEKILARHADVVMLIQRGKSLRDAAARTGKSQGTVQKVKRLLGGADY